MVRIRKKNSVHATTGDAFAGTGPDTLIVDKGAFLITDAGGAGARLAGDWTVVINGTVRSFDDLTVNPGLAIAPMLLGTSMNVTIGATGIVRGSRVALDASEAGTIANKGRIIGDSVSVRVHTDNGDITLNNRGIIKSQSSNTVFISGSEHFILNNGGLVATSDLIVVVMEQSSLGSATITNWGTLDGVIALGKGNDEFTNFKMIGNKLVSGTVTSVINLGSGTDLFHGGSNKETVNGGPDGDTMTLGRGNDVFIVLHDDGQDSVNGQGGIDTYDIRATGADVLLFLVNLDAEIHQGLDPFRATEFFGPIFPPTTVLDEVLNFENVNGWAGEDDIWGSAEKNVIRGNGGTDNLHGLGGRDVLEGGADADTFWFHAKSDSKVKAAKRDLITDFVSGEDKIELTDIDANSQTPLVNDAFHLTANGGRGKFAHDAGELRFQFAKGLTIVSGDVNGDGKPDFSIALKGNIALVDTDFVL